MTLDKNTYVKEFIQKLHTGEYMIDPKANAIEYDDIKTLAGALQFALTEYDYVTTHSLTSVYPETANDAYNMITAAFTHGVVINKHDLRTKLRQTEELLTRCEEDKARLEKDNNDLRRELIDCQQIKETMQERLLSHSQTNRDDDDET